MSTPRGPQAGRWLALAASVVVVATVAAALYVTGSPAEQREAKLDRRRTADLQRIERALRAHARRTGALPPGLATLAAQPGQRLPIADPVSGAPYAYEVLGPRRFRLCARFATDTAQVPDAAIAWSDDWRHGAGRQCFERELEPRRAASG
ncbi:hypothetical protein [Vulcaniibacterium tengchongense]|uniref:Uncharacterized protein n=1 Tax=Vulcaniibacterium tengchongense TaxID=1273429 RepID=A0A3N4VBH8_9GAMM|nr:hypothetical protein [Vulcaniibacterium tengchongense]RPE79968.1 hypothetical protein EDC50_1798 [Vulcaniibacterium tengchongense]